MNAKNVKPPIIDPKEVKVWNILDRIVEQDEELLFKTIIEYPSRKYYLYILKNDKNIYCKYFYVKPLEYYMQFIKIIREKYSYEKQKDLLELEDKYFDMIITDSDYFDRMKTIGYKGKVSFNNEESIQLIKNILTINEDYALLSYGLDGFMAFYKQLKGNKEKSNRTIKEECNNIIKLIRIFLKNINEDDYNSIHFGFYVELY